jgi:hypothetical protein
MTPPTRTYTLPEGELSGTVGGVQVSCNTFVENIIKDLGNPELWKFLVDAAVHAALERGCHSVLIR